MGVLLRGIRRPGGAAVEVEHSPLQTATLTTDPDTFEVDHIFDLGEGAHVALVTMTCLEVVPDGETFGVGAGEIVAEQWNSEKGVFFAMSLTGSPGEFVKALAGHENVALGYWAGDGAPGWPDAGVIEPGQFIMVTFVSFRYLKVGTKLFTGTNGDDYAGANNPQITVRFDVVT